MHHPVGMQVSDSIQELPQEWFDGVFRHELPLRMAVESNDLLWITMVMIHGGSHCISLNICERIVLFSFEVSSLTAKLTKRSCSAYSNTIWIDLSSSKTSVSPTMFSWCNSRQSYWMDEEYDLQFSPKCPVMNAAKIEDKAWKRQLTAISRHADCEIPMYVAASPSLSGLNFFIAYSFPSSLFNCKRRVCLVGDLISHQDMIWSVLWKQLTLLEGSLSVLVLWLCFVDSAISTWADKAKNIVFGGYLHSTSIALCFVLCHGHCWKLIRVLVLHERFFYVGGEAEREGNLKRRGEGGARWGGEMP